MLLPCVDYTYTHALIHTCMHAYIHMPTSFLMFLHLTRNIGSGGWSKVAVSRPLFDGGSAARGWVPEGMFKSYIVQRRQGKRSQHICWTGPWQINCVSLFPPHISVCLQEQVNEEHAKSKQLRIIHKNMLE